MKLYLTPGTCSMASNIALHEAGIQFELAKVDKRTKRVDGVDFLTINPKGYVPALQLDDGQVLTENVAVLQYIADLNPNARLAPPAGTLERYRLQEWLSFINSEVHKAFSPLFSSEATEDMKTYSRNYLAKRLAYVEQALGEKKYLMGDQFTVADAYLSTVLGWGSLVKVDIGPRLKAYLDGVRARPKVIEAMTAEGMIRPHPPSTQASGATLA
jgi:glutathione S-transferase